FFSGDDAILKGIIRFLEDEGFRVVGSEEILAGLLAPYGILGKVRPDGQAKDDIAQGMEVAKALGEMDIGQAVIVENGHVLGTEGAEGTDALIERCSKLRKEKGRAVLVKVRKPSQDGRADRPAVGVQTVEKIHAAGFGGIAVEANEALIL